MTAERFLDTNFILYAYDLDAAKKRAIAQTLVEDAWNRPERTAISVQILQEFHVNFLGKGHSISEADALVGDFSGLPVIDNTLALFRVGPALQNRWRISLRDSMILAAAHASGARELVTEDFNHGQDYGGIRAINPFR